MDRVKVCNFNEILKKIIYLDYVCKKQTGTTSPSGALGTEGIGNLKHRILNIEHQTSNPQHLTSINPSPRPPPLRGEGG